MVVTCESGGSVRGEPSPSPTEAVPVAATRVAYTGVDGKWQGRDEYRICVEDRSRTVGDDRLKSATEASLVKLASAASPALPVKVEAGCPYDYPDGIVVTRDSPAKYTLQIYADASIDRASGSILEHWFRGNSDFATPITFAIRLPVMLAANNAALEAALAPLVPPEPTRR